MRRFTVSTTLLSKYRNRIDEVDEEILRLIAERGEVAREVGRYKRDAGIPMMQPDRITEVLRRTAEIAEQHGTDSAFARRLFELIIDETCRVEDDVINDEPNSRNVSDSSSSLKRSQLARRARRIDHVAIAVRDLEPAIASLCERFGFELTERNKVSGELSGMEYAVMRAGDAKLVLCQGDSPRSNVSLYIEHYGPGVQHVAVELDDAEAILADLQGRDCPLLTGVIHGPGLDQIFTKRDENSGMQFEFISRAENEDFANSNITELFDAMDREGVY
jgi:chorismate mutase-like protein